MGNEVIYDVLMFIGGIGGVIIIDVKGNISLLFNIVGMYCVSKLNILLMYVGIFKDE